MINFFVFVWYNSGMETIRRKSMLYKTGVEYGDWAMNHVLGCAHGCAYPCYAFLQKKRFGVVADMDAWRAPKLVENTMELLDAELSRLKSKIKRVQLCFATDPFMEGFPEVGEMSLRAVERINREGIPCSVLTKGVLPHALAGLHPGNECGITLASLDPAWQEAMEPGAVPPGRRLAALKALADAGVRTWVSVEPYPGPGMAEDDLPALLEAVSFTDRIVFGRLNYRKGGASPEAAEWYRTAARTVRDFCRDRGIECVIKRGTPA